MNKDYLAIGVIVLVVLVGAGLFFISSQSGAGAPVTTDKMEKKIEPSETDKSMTSEYKFTNPKKSAHYESNTPAHGAVLAGVPVNVVIDVNFDLAAPSSISIKSGGKKYGVGETIIDSSKLAMRRNLDASSPDGLYTVTYNACWPDKTCHDGSFQFAIDRTKAAGYQDLRNKSTVSVNLKNITFSPQNIRISQGTKIVWTNSDDVDHYVNTDSHPAHTYYLAQNSKALAKGESYSLTFNTAGIYPHHCSAHAGSMAGTVLVE